MAYDLQREEDVKEYLENLGLEYRFGCFSEKNPDACQRLGEYFETIKKDFDKALKVYKNNCDEYSYGKSCYQYAVLGLKGRGPKHIREEVPTYFEKGCDAGNSDSCTTGGMLLLSTGGERAGTDSRGPKANKGAGPAYKAKNTEIAESAAADRGAEREAAVKKDINAMGNTLLESRNDKERLLPARKKGVDLLQKGCEMNNGFACYCMSALFIVGKDSVNLAVNLDEAFKYSEKACRLGQPQACGNMSMMYKKGEGVAKDEVKSELYKAMALDMAGQGHRGIEFQRGS